MGFFTWLGSLADQLLEWLGRAVKAFIDALIAALKKIWETAVKTVLIAAFGFASVLYVIFYTGYIAGETIMEIWDPRSNKPSEVFKIRQAPSGARLNKTRNEAQILEMVNSY